MSSEKQTWRVFSDTIPSEGSALTLANDEHHYLAQVLRLRSGELLEVADGRGVAAVARVEEIAKRESRLSIISRREIPFPRFPVQVFVGQPKPGALDELVPLAAELGANALHVVRLQRTAIKSTPRMDRLGRVALETTRITKSPWAMQIHYHETLTAALREAAGGISFLCDESPLYEGGSAYHNHLLNVLERRFPASLPQGTALALFIGPEASFTDEERSLICTETGAVAVSLGQNILRVPTATASAVAIATGYLCQWQETAFAESHAPRRHEP